MKRLNPQIQLSLARLVVGAVIVFGLGFVISSRLSIGVYWPQSTAGNRPDFTSLNSVYDTLQRKFDGRLDNAKLRIAVNASSGAFERVEK